MDKQLAECFFEEASKAFAFVVDGHSFAAPQLHVDDQINFAFVTFMGKNLAIECILDEREDDVSCEIVLAPYVKNTAFYAVDENGKRVRERLSSLLIRRGIRERLFTKVGGLALREKIKTTLNDFASLLKKYGAEVLNDSPMALA